MTWLRLTPAPRGPALHRSALHRSALHGSVARATLTACALASLLIGPRAAAQPAPEAPAAPQPCAPDDPRCKRAPKAPGPPKEAETPPVHGATPAPPAPPTDTTPPPPAWAPVPPPPGFVAPAAPRAAPSPAPVSDAPPGAPPAPDAGAPLPVIAPRGLSPAPPAPRYDASATAAPAQAPPARRLSWWARRSREFAQHTELSALTWGDIAIVGVTAGFRYRPGHGRFALDAGLGLFGGQDWQERLRFEVPILVDGTYFVNPKSTAQFFLTGGLGVSFAWSSDARWDVVDFGNDDDDDGLEVYNTRRYVHLGGRVGAGVEIRLADWASLNFAVRVFARQNVARGEDEFIERRSDGTRTGRTTNFSMGVLPSIGSTFYF